MTPFSEKQMQVLCWWGEKSPHRNKLAVICDGAVRSGKTTCMGISFFLWAMARFQNTSFAVCGKTIRSVRRNVVAELIPKLKSMGFSMRVRQAENEIILSYQGRENRFYLFGGRDESSAALIQGMTLGGVLFDEVALMPRSFVEQGIARCSLKNAKLWFNCNPEHPQHWFYREWILKAESRNALYLHFTMEDNPSLSEDVRKRYRTMFSGAFYSRFIEGKWTAATGLIYPFALGLLCEVPKADFERYAVSIDYGTVNPTSMGLWGLLCGVSDFVAVGDVQIKAIGADGQQMDSEVPVRQMLEQIVAKMGIPPFLLGLSWSSTERMSSQQADMLTSELTAYRRILEPAVLKICKTWLRLNGLDDTVEIDWNEITMQDEVDHANAAYLMAKTEQLLKEGEA